MQTKNSWRWVLWEQWKYSARLRPLWRALGLFK
jgi:hypothetical protein